jgi:hypothetical protein
VRPIDNGIKEISFLSCRIPCFVKGVEEEEEEWKK